MNISLQNHNFDCSSISFATMTAILAIMKINFHINPIYFGSYSCGTGLILPEGSEVYSSSPVGKFVRVAVQSGIAYDVCTGIKPDCRPDAAFHFNFSTPPTTHEPILLCCEIRLVYNME